VFADLVNRGCSLGRRARTPACGRRSPQECRPNNGHPKAITQVAIDMSPAYVKGVREHFGNAALVFDKFHVIQEANEGVEAVRRLEVHQDESKAQQLARANGIFRKNPATHTEREVENAWRRWTGSI